MKSNRSNTRRHYKKRVAAGLCAYFGCRAAPESRRKFCRTHLQQLAKNQTKIVADRKKRRMCTYCGKLPQFWGLYCIICRQKFAKTVLPPRAKRALRRYRDAERRFELELRQAHARFAIRKFLLTGDVTGNYAKALRLYAGLDTGRWRTYEEVGKLMHLTKERVRVLLKPSKHILADTLGENIPWRPVTRNGHDHFPRRVYKRKRKTWKASSTIRANRTSVTNSLIGRAA